jgi:hypothetical protein
MLQVFDQPAVEIVLRFTDVFRIPLRIPHFDDLTGADERHLSVDPRQFGEVRSEGDPPLIVKRRFDGVLHELQVVAALVGVDSGLLSFETGHDLLPLGEWVEKQAWSDTPGRHEGLPGFSIAKPRRQADPPLFIDGVCELTKKWRSDPCLLMRA